MEAILREKEREDKLQSAKKKLKSYRARQSKASLNGPISPNDGVGSSSSSSRRISHASSMSHKSKASITGPPASPVRAAARQHAHRRSLSVSGNTAAGQSQASSPQSTSHTRRNSTRRHSRNISISINSTPSFQADSPLATSISPQTSATISGASPSLTTTRFNTLSASASSPSLSSHSLFAAQQQQQQQHASSSSLSTFGTLSTTNRQSVPHFTTAPNGRILSPSSSPMVPQHSSSSASPQNYSPFRRASLQMPKPVSPSGFAENTFPTPPPAPSHARRPSKHTRRTSVATRRESMEIMAGTLNFLPPSSPEPSNNYSATGAFLAASADMSRSSTWASSSSSSDSSTVKQPSQQSSPFDAEVTFSEEDQRKAALRALEGTLTEKSDAIELPTEFSLPAFSGVVSPTSQKMEKRASWNGAPLTNAGGKGATDLGMLVEEEEEDESEAQDLVSSLGPSSTVLNKAPPPASGNKRQRPSSLIFPPSRNLPFASARAFQTQASPAAAEPISPTTKEPPTNIQKTGPRPLSLSSSVSSPSLHSSTTPSFITSEKSARRLSGLKSLTLTSPEHALSGTNSSAASAPSPASNAIARRRLSGAPVPSTSSPASSTRPFSIASSSSILKERDGLVSPDGMRSFQLGAGSSTRTKKSSPSLGSIALSSSTNSTMGGTPARSRASLSYRTTPSPIATSAASTSFSNMTSPNTTYNNSRRYSDLSFASSAGPFGFGDLVMEESILQEEDEEEEICPQDVESEEKDDIEKTERLDLLHVERPALSRSSSSNSSVTEDPVILSMQVQALRSQIEHLRTESSALQSQVTAAEQARASEGESLRNDVSQLKDANEELEMEREMLREDIDGWRTRCNDLERTLQLERSRAEDERKEGILLREKVRKLGDRLAAAQSCLPGESSGEDAALAIAQAKLISEMRDQIFTLAAALERERLKNVNGGEGNHSTSPLLKALASYQGKVVNVQPISGRHNESAAGSNASSFNFSMSSGSGSIRSGLGNATEDTSVADDESVFGLGSKSPVSPAFASSGFPSSGISIHPMSMPLRHVDSNVALGGLHTLAEEEEEEEEEEEVLEATMSELDEEEDKIPELVPDEFRMRTQSASTGSTDTNDHMPLTPARESPNMPHQKPTHDRSDSFLKQWSFPKGTVIRSSFDESCDRFWSIRHDSLPPLPVSDNAFETPFSAEISLDEDYFTSAFSKKLSVDNAPTLSISPAAQGPPPSRSSIQAQRISAEVESAPPSATSSVGSRLSWMWSGYLKPSPVPAAPAQQITAPEGASPYSSISSVASSLAPPVPPKSAPVRPAVITSRKLLKLEPSPSSRLDFSHSCTCDGSPARIIRL